MRESSRYAAGPETSDRGPSGDNADEASAPQSKTALFRALFESMYEALCRYALTIVSSWDTAEDLVQDVFVRLWERHRDRLPLREPKGYLFRAVRNAALNHIGAARNARRNADADVQTLPGTASFSPEDTLNAQITREAIHASIRALPDRQEEVFRLSRQHHLTYAEIAEVLGISVKTVETHMGRALAFLRNRLSDRLE
mgnify:FL=1